MTRCGNWGSKALRSNNRERRARVLGKIRTLIMMSLSNQSRLVWLRVFSPLTERGSPIRMPTKVCWNRKTAKMKF